MSYSIAIPLLTPQVNNSSGGLPFDDGGNYGLNFPTNMPGWAWADEITYVISVGPPFGTPTNWSVSAKLQFLQPNTVHYQFVQPRWFDLQPEQIENCVVEKCGFYGGSHTAPLDGSFGLIADDTDTLPTVAAPITVQRTVKNFGFLARVQFALTHTGGTSPIAGISLTAIPKAY
jgi:hypothetical protein